MKRISAITHHASRGILFLTICGLIGWCYEAILTSILWGRFCGFFARGLLHVPICPIYGFFAFLLLAIFQIPFFKSLTGWKRWICIFAVGSGVSTVLELGCSYLLEAVFGYALWSYADWPLHFQERISLFSSLLFGVLSLVLFLGVVPVFQKVIPKLSPRVIGLAGGTCAWILGADLIITLFS